MKKITLCLIATMFAALSTAQDSRNEQDRVAFNQRMNFNPENMAAWQTGQLQQALQLDSMQYQIIYLMNYADAVTMQDSMKARRERVAKMRAEGKRPERPTEEQMKARMEIEKARRARTEKMRAEGKKPERTRPTEEQMKAMMELQKQREEVRNEQMKQILTPEQYEKYLKYTKEQKERMRHRSQGRRPERGEKR